MKIMQVIPSLNIGGAEIMLETLTTELHNNHHDVFVTVFYDSDSPIKKRLQNKGIRIVSLNKELGFSLKTLKQLSRIIRGERPDVIHTHLHVLPYVWIASGEKKIIHTVHSIASKEQSGFGKKVCGWIYKNSSKCTPVAISNMVHDSLIDEYKIKKKIPVIANGIYLEGRKTKKEYGLKNNISIYHVGRLTKLKNHRLMMESVKSLSEDYPNIILHFWGDGPDRDELKKYAEELDVAQYVKFEGLCSNIEEILPLGDIFLLPSEYEGLPMSLIEAMAAGLPVIASNVGGIPEIIDNDIDGILLGSNAENLEEKLRELIGDENLREKIGRLAKEKAKLFSSSYMMEGYLTEYGKAKGKKQ